MIRRLLCLAVVLPLVLAVSGSAGSTAADQTARVKTPKGLKDNLQVAANPNGDVLVAYDSRGKVLTGLLKPKGTGKYKGKKAKPVSSGSDAHRPTAVFDVNTNEYLVSWDTGPESLFTASIERLALEPSDILARRVRAKNGKGFKPVIETVSDGLVNYSPLLTRTEEDDLDLFYSTTDPTAARVGGARAVITSRVTVSRLLRGRRISDRRLEKLEDEGLIEVKWTKDEDGYTCAIITVINNDNPTAKAAEVPPTGDAAHQPWTPSMFPGVETTAGALAILDGTKLEMWIEGSGPGRRVWWEVRTKDDGTPVLGPTPAPNAASHASNAARSGAQSRTDRPDHTVFVATQGDDGKAHLLEFDDTGALVNNRVLFAHKNDMSNLRLVALPDGRGMVAWIKAKNKKNDEVWIHVFDF